MMTKSLHAATLASLIVIYTTPFGLAEACPLHVEASHIPIVVADNAATSTPAAGDTKAPDTVAFPNSPNGSPAATNQGAPVVTDKAACSGTGPTATCGDSPAPSAKADTSDVKIATPTTSDGSTKP